MFGLKVAALVGNVGPGLEIAAQARWLTVRPTGANYGGLLAYRHTSGNLSLGERSGYELDALTLAFELRTL